MAKVILALGLLNKTNLTNEMPLYSKIGKLTGGIYRTDICFFNIIYISFFYAFYKLYCLVQSYDIFPSFEDKRPTSVFYTKGHILRILYPSFFYSFILAFKDLLHYNRKPEKINCVKNNISFEQSMFCLTFPKRISFCNLRYTV